MDPKETRASLRVLLAVALADGELDLEEKRLLDVVAQHQYEDDEPPPSRFDDARELARNLAQITTPEVRHLTWKGALAVALVNGACSKAEHALLERIHAALEPDEPIPEITLAERKYGERMAIVEQHIAEATKDFLHQVKSGPNGERLSQRQYDALATALVRKKRELYAQAMSILPPK